MSFCTHCGNLKGTVQYETSSVFGKMELPLRDYTQCEVRSVTQFLAAAGWTKATIHKELKRVYGTDVTAITMVGRWVKQFEEGRADVNNVEQTGRPSDMMTIENKNIQQLRDLFGRRPV